MNYKESKTGEIKKELVVVMKLLGFNTMSLEDGDFQVIAEEIKKNYGYMEFGTVRKAFDLAMNGTLDEEIRTDRRFSYFYVSKYLLGLRRYELRRKDTREPLNASRQIEMKKRSKEEICKDWYEVVEKYYKKGLYPMFSSPEYWAYAFWYMEKQKMIDLSNEEKEMYMENVKADLEAVSNSPKYRVFKDADLGVEEKIFIPGIEKAIENANNILKDEKLLVLECRKRLVEDYFKNAKTH